MTHEISDGETREERFPVEPWRIREVGLDRDFLAQSESLFALSNGHIGIRGNLDEGDPNGLPGSYLNSFFETRPLPYAEAGYGYPESGQTILNVTNGKLIRLLVDDEPLDLRYGIIEKHERILDLKTGILERDLIWQSPAGTRVRVRSSRFVSLRHRSILAIKYRVEAVDTPVRVVVQSELVANERLPKQSKDPRVAEVIKNALKPVEHWGNDKRAYLIHRTAGSKLQMAAMMDHTITTPDEVGSELEVHDNWARLMFPVKLHPGQGLELTKIVGYGWSSQRSIPALRDQVSAAVVSALYAGWDMLAQEQEEDLADFWKVSDVEIDGDDELQQAVRFGIFHSYQAGVRAEQRAVPAKGLTGPGYDGHAFWDTEMFVLPLLTAVAPDAAADALRWRAGTLDLARERANTLHLKGATFPWRTIRGQECSAYWPAGTAAMHVNGDIAAAITRYLRWNDDPDFVRDTGLPVLVETARLWISLGYYGDDGSFHIDGVTGPDEYSAIVDDNMYTNLLAAGNLVDAADIAEHCPEEASKYAVTKDEIANWRAMADVVAMPFSDVHDVYEQSRGYTALEVWNFDKSAKEDEYPLLLNTPYFNLYRKQVIKQSDLMLALHWTGEKFTMEEKAKAFAYYERLTVRDSSLSACTQAVVAAEVGHLDLATDYLAEAALMDLHDLNKNGGDGVHIASLAGGWIAVVAGFGGMRDHGERLTFRPQLPPTWTRLKFGARYRGALLHVEIDRDTVSYTISGEGTVPITHLSDNGDREEFEVSESSPATRPWKPVEPLTPTPTQPPGRTPHRAVARAGGGTSG